MNNKLSPKDFEKLSEVVTKAIAESPQVRRVLRRLKKDADFDFDRCLAIVLKVQPKESAKKSTSKNPRSTRKRGSQAQQRHAPLQYIDGCRLTENEVNFEEYCRERFDSKHWLRTHGMRLEPE
ncbi:MAG: hypothetical protein HYY96_13025 [Candidatus Tectomicrobia bacterium]|nr:hypothetical protein [Candidatus Tectomicrobia bacterium]